MQSNCNNLFSSSLFLGSIGSSPKVITSSPHVPLLLTWSPSSKNLRAFGSMACRFACFSNKLCRRVVNLHPYSVSSPHYIVVETTNTIRHAALHGFALQIQCINYKATHLVPDRNTQLAACHTDRFLLELLLDRVLLCTTHFPTTASVLGWRKNHF